jgi:hypothetical protein
MWRELMAGSATECTGAPRSDIIPAALETAVPDTASQMNGAERGTSEQNPARVSETTNLCN